MIKIPLRVTLQSTYYRKKRHHATEKSQNGVAILLPAEIHRRYI